MENWKPESSIVIHPSYEKLERTPRVDDTGFGDSFFDYDTEDESSTDEPDSFGGGCFYGKNGYSADFPALSELKMKLGTSGCFQCRIAKVECEDDPDKACKRCCEENTICLPYRKKKA